MCMLWETLHTSWGERVLRRAELSTLLPGFEPALEGWATQLSSPSFFNDFSPEQWSQNRINGFLQVFNQHHVSSFQGLLYGLEVAAEKVSSRMRLWPGTDSEEIQQDSGGSGAQG